MALGKLGRRGGFGSLGALGTVGYIPQSQTIFAAMSPAPSASRKYVIDQTVRRLVNAGIWTKLSALWVLAAHASAPSLINWVAPGTNNLTAVNSPAFTADLGYKGNGSSSYLNPGFTAAPAPYSQDSACEFAWIYQPSPATYAGEYYFGSFRSFIRQGSSGGGGVDFALTGGASDQTYGNASYLYPFVAFSRVSSAGISGYGSNTDGSWGKQSTVANVSAGTTPSDFKVLAQGQTAGAVGGYSTAGLSIVGFGGGLTDADAANLQQAMLYYMQNVAEVPVSSIAAWGDSLTSGTGASVNNDYLSQLSGLISGGRTLYNGGVSGNTSTQIKARFLVDTIHKGWITLIWAGRNNYTSPTTVKADIAQMVASLPSGARYLVLSVINGDYANEYVGQTDYNTLVQLNADLATLYGARFVDVRTPLVAAGAPGGSSPSATDYAHDVPPTGIRFDQIHLLDAGYAIVAAQVYAKIAANGW
ncbi:SGNH/GDSL hydrolase family protein [Bradyrhizobium sp. 87]|uniref:SGNH/GDSL hydrolase family protein n=1 Tax=Bradyrhizobium sp. 87 TaxID=2782682 RepID=UPI001FFAD10A|nr:SGNH/GDSL hydrolase family protein [Bradyrhizobium sp. 87]MCK1430919.1 SGNH/GDSL hydrolase family protein [Bradyrhizobium sp. 87]